MYEATASQEFAPTKTVEAGDDGIDKEQKEEGEASWLHRAGGWSRPNLTLSVQQFGIDDNKSGGCSYGSGSSSSMSGALSSQRLKTIVDALNFQVRL